MLFSTLVTSNTWEHHYLLVVVAMAAEPPLHGRLAMGRTTWLGWRATAGAQTRSNMREIRQIAVVFMGVAVAATATGVAVRAAMTTDPDAARATAAQVLLGIYRAERLTFRGWMLTDDGDTAAYEGEAVGDDWQSRLEVSGRDETNEHAPLDLTGPPVTVHRTGAGPVVSRDGACADLMSAPTDARWILGASNPRTVIGQLIGMVSDRSRGFQTEACGTHCLWVQIAAAREELAYFGSGLFDRSRRGTSPTTLSLRIEPGFAMAFEARIDPAGSFGGQSVGGRMEARSNDLDPVPCSNTPDVPLETWLTTLQR
jgi:hypothetical protein